MIQQNLSEEQIQRRKLGIGGSDAKIIANGTQEDWHNLWLQKQVKKILYLMKTVCFLWL